MQCFSNFNTKNLILLDRIVLQYLKNIKCIKYGHNIFTKATAFSSVNLTATTGPVIPIFQASSRGFEELQVMMLTRIEV